jgi:hypothetical protein
MGVIKFAKRHRTCKANNQAQARCFKKEPEGHAGVAPPLKKNRGLWQWEGERPIFTKRRMTCKANNQAQARD